MNVQDVPRGDAPRDDRRDGDYASVALIGEAGALLAQRRRDIPDDFLAKLFGLAVPQDLERYTAAELAGIAERSWSFLQERPGRRRQDQLRAASRQDQRRGASDHQR